MDKDILKLPLCSCTISNLVAASLDVVAKTAATPPRSAFLWKEWLQPALRPLACILKYRDLISEKDARELPKSIKAATNSLRSSLLQEQMQSDLRRITKYHKGSVTMALFVIYLVKSIESKATTFQGSDILLSSVAKASTEGKDAVRILLGVLPVLDSCDHKHKIVTNAKSSKAPVATQPAENLWVKLVTGATNLHTVLEHTDAMFGDANKPAVQALPSPALLRKQLMEASAASYDAAKCRAEREHQIQELYTRLNERSEALQAEEAEAESASQFEFANKMQQRLIAWEAQLKQRRTVAALELAELIEQNDFEPTENVLDALETFRKRTSYDDSPAEPSPHLIQNFIDMRDRVLAQLRRSHTRRHRLAVHSTHQEVSTAAHSANSANSADSTDSFNADSAATIGSVHQERGETTSPWISAEQKAQLFAHVKQILRSDESRHSGTGGGSRARYQRHVQTAAEQHRAARLAEIDKEIAAYVRAAGSRVDASDANEVTEGEQVEGDGDRQEDGDG
eukprot:TRINITY_DN10577_c0_g1_i1.p1 TRINITY_DN10577_c0_g1~~TRINITY_DN10577_c0_g1_i1.p1  ORF type:complete len:526 (+),score=99.78 TRINITY_DN10577_c0_g1_i1:44-1579(+)